MPEQTLKERLFKACKSVWPSTTLNVPKTAIRVAYIDENGRTMEVAWFETPASKYTNTVFAAFLLDVMPKGTYTAWDRLMGRYMTNIFAPDEWHRSPSPIMAEHGDTREDSVINAFIAWRESL